jgi:hypothetical protein
VRQAGLLDRTFLPAQELLNDYQCAISIKRLGMVARLCQPRYLFYRKLVGSASRLA